MVLLGWGTVFILINHRDLNFLLLQSSETLMTSVHPVYTLYSIVCRGLLLMFYVTVDIMKKIQVANVSDALEASIHYTWQVETCDPHTPILVYSKVHVQ